MPGWIARLIGRTLAWVITLAVPLSAIWVGTSLAAFHFGMAELAAGAGLLLFPVLPLTWDLASEVRRRRKGDTRERILTRSDRALVRTFVISALFLAVMFGALPRQVFQATSARGDWFLDAAEGTWVEPVRAQVHRAAMGLEWLYELASENRWEDQSDDGVQVADESADPQPAPGIEVPAAESGDEPAAARVPGRLYAGDPLWPLEPVAHPAALSVPTTSMESIESVALWLKEHTVGEAELAKAIHDFVALHVDYDAAALAAGQYPPQDAATVFRTGDGVCAGYANLFASMATAAGLEALYVVGDSRSPLGDGVSPDGHAWNVVRVDGTWHLVDVTWDSGHVDGVTFTQKYRTSYLFTPAHVFGETHYPDLPAWQLRGDAPIDRATFQRQLIASPVFHARGLQFVAPQRSPVEVGRNAELRLSNPNRARVWVHIRRNEDDPGTACGRPTDAEQLVVRCDVPSSGSWQIVPSIEETANTYYAAAAVRVIR